MCRGTLDRGYLKSSDWEVAKPTRTMITLSFLYTSRLIMPEKDTEHVRVAKEVIDSTSTEEFFLTIIWDKPEGVSQTPFRSL